MDLLVRNYNVDTADALMCRNSLTVNWDGQIHDCDFNGQLQLSMHPLGKNFEILIVTIFLPVINYIS